MLQEAREVRGKRQELAEAIPSGKAVKVKCPTRRGPGDGPLARGQGGKSSCTKTAPCGVWGSAPVGTNIIRQSKAFCD